MSVEKEYRRLQTRMALITGLNESLIGLLMNGAVATMLIAAIPQVTAGTLDGVYLAVISLGIMASFEAFVPLPEALQYLDMNVRAADRLFEIIDAEPEVKDPPNPERPARNYRLTINGLSFRYSPQNDYALRNITMEVPWRQKIAVVGPSGAGKSTLINLLMRFWNYQQGSIKIGGQEIKDMAQEEVRKLFAVISQHTHLFTGTIRENLLLANPDASEQQLIRACEQAQIHRFISGLEQGYDTWIGEQGLRLSGGERQRLAIARALLKNAPILILDEATSNLDAITEEELLETLFTLSNSHTVFHITHRLKKLNRMDHIYVLYQGEIIQQGTHRQLLKEEGLYRKMWEIQMQTELLEAMES
ncbi:MAG TPA: ABC transporter ATP-binding protein [Caldithrix abyssi]|uniref:ABC transporter ATP-binding protein n=1 Tax=Caldithrix abyssi TaxID=187145 RepID=A0A7V5PMC2_CALAY|nr:ABC transporter ATP-binding protein [Caldithrix abyssi]